MILSSNARWSHLSPITRLIFHNLHIWDLLRYSGISFNQEMSFPRVLLVLRSTVPQALNKNNQSPILKQGALGVIEFRYVGKNLGLGDEFSKISK